MGREESKGHRLRGLIREEEVEDARTLLLGLHRSLEESAASVGASGLRIFSDIMLLLIWRGVLTGARMGGLFGSGGG